jgi:Zn-dependent protease
MAGLIDLLFSDPITFTVIVVGLVLAISVHEFAHAWTADHLGDPTPRSLDRVTLNPLAHLDPIGTLMILFIGFGWGKPVTFDPYNLENPKKDTLLISLAGPVSNIILASILSVGIVFVPFLSQALVQIIFLNVMLAIFNLVPIAPLDGSKILSGLLPHRQAIEYDQLMRRYGTLILLFLIIPFGGRSIISSVILPIIEITAGLIIFSITGILSFLLPI